LIACIHFYRATFKAVRHAIFSGESRVRGNEPKACY